MSAVPHRAAGVAASLLALTGVVAQQRGSFTAEVYWTADAPLVACAVGDPLPAAAGREIVAVGADGRVFVLRRESSRVVTTAIPLRDCVPQAVAVGDCDPAVGGQELLVVGAAADAATGVFVLLRREGAGWRVERGELPRPLVGAVVVDGMALLLDVDGQVHQVQSEAGACRVVGAAAGGAGGGWAITAAREHVHAGIADAGLVRVGVQPDALVLTPIDRGARPGRCLASDGVRLLVGGTDGGIAVVDLTGPPRPATAVTAVADLRHLACADLDPTRAGAEVAAATGARLLILRDRNGRWRSETVHEDAGEITALAAADVDGRPGAELVATTRDGRVVVVYRRAETVRGPQADDWSVDVVLETGVVTGGCAVGDLDPEHPGDEIVTVARDGAVTCIWRADDGWQHEVVHRGAGEYIQVAIGDAVAAVPGNEIVAVGVAQGAERDDVPGIATVLHRAADGRWSAETAFAATALQHGACAVDGAVFVTGYDRRVHRLLRSDAGWRAEPVAELPGDGKGALATPWGVLVTSTDGSLVRVRQTDGGWRADVVDHRPSPRSRVGTDGQQVITSDNDGTLSLLTPGDTIPWPRVEIHREFDLLRGAVLAPLGDGDDHATAATAGYERKVTLLQRVDGRWWSRLLYRDADRLHHLASGEVDGRPGVDLVACGFSGRVLVLSRGAAGHR
jgi:hypothetical protein